MVSSYLLMMIFFDNKDPSTVILIEIYKVNYPEK